MGRVCARGRLGRGRACGTAGAAVGAAVVQSEPRARAALGACDCRRGPGRGGDRGSVCRPRAATSPPSLPAADALRARTIGDTVTYVVNRNINYTNICTYGCKFCAFSKGRHNLGHRDAPYDLDARRDRPAHQRGLAARRHRGVPAGRHPSRLYGRDLSRHRCRRESRGAGHSRARLLAAGDLAWRGQRSACRSSDYLARLKAAGLASLPGTAAEILDDEVRAILCPDKITTAAMVRGDGGRPRRWPQEHGHHHVRPRRCLPALGAPPLAGARAAGQDQAASPSSCRWRSCTWKRRSTSRARRARGQPAARPC